MCVCVYLRAKENTWVNTHHHSVSSGGERKELEWSDGEEND